jgi:hypothetical protein
VDSVQSTALSHVMCTQIVPISFSAFSKFQCIVIFAVDIITCTAQSHFAIDIITCTITLCKTILKSGWR